MPIVFDQITGTVAPETPNAPDTQRQEAPPAPVALERQVRQIQAKHHRRMARLKAD
jgi:hypothetical protein